MSYCSLQMAVDMCREIEPIAAANNCHVALTGGALYKDGKRKDMDIVFYRSSWSTDIDMAALFTALRGIRLYKQKDYGRVVKGSYRGFYVDMFFPERTGVEEGEYADTHDVGFAEVVF